MNVIDTFCFGIVYTCSIHRTDIMLLSIYINVINLISEIFCLKNPTSILILRAGHLIPTHGMWVAPTAMVIGLYTTTETRMSDSFTDFGG
jgi:hypothetical protein